MCLGMVDGPITAEKPTNLFLLDPASSDKGGRLLRNSAKVGALQFGDPSGDVGDDTNAIFSLSASEDTSYLKKVGSYG